MKTHWVMILGFLLCTSQLVFAQTTDAPVLEVKFKQGEQIRFRNDRPKTVSLKNNHEEVSRLIEEVAQDGGTWKRSFPSVSERFLERIHTTAKTKRKNTPDLNLYYRLELSPSQNMTNVIASLRSMSQVEAVYVVPKPVPPPLPPDYTITTTPSSSQLYIDPAPVGVDARFAWSNGWNGAGVQICDIEYDWNANHDDLPTVTLVGGTKDSPFGEDHGTAVLGQMASLDNGWGTKGIAYGSTYFFAPANTVEGGYNVGDAIMAALSVLNPGDVILIEQQISGPYGGENYVPVEWYKPWYDAIVFAVNQGVTVVQAAGNGFQNLDDPIYSQGNGGHYPFLPANDSGSLIIGAGGPARRLDALERLPFSNYGTTLDLQGWGAAVCTTGYGYSYNAEGKNREYTTSFSGTSSASPFVAAAAAVVQQVYKNTHGTNATPQQIKNILRTTGTPQMGTDIIGPLPNLKDAILSIVNTTDSDNDGIDDLTDNCPLVSNPSQMDQDQDGIGDVCDNCPQTANPGQEDIDGDLLGDLCDDDMDGDGILNPSDNCPSVSNPAQVDSDNDQVGDVCDPCITNNGIDTVAAYPHSPTVLGDPTTQNHAGEDMDLNSSGGALSTVHQCGFGSLGSIYVNYDESYLYLGADNVAPGGDNHACILFLGLSSLSDDANNLWHLNGAPNGLDLLHNIAFTQPMDIALIIGDEWGDGTYTNFNLGNGYDFGQGAFYLTPSGTFFPVANTLLAQFDGAFGSTSSSDEDGDRITDRWECAIPWASLNAPDGINSITSLSLCGIIASDSTLGTDRYLSGNYLGESAAVAALDENQNFGFSFVTLTPKEIILNDADRDGLPNDWEYKWFGNITNAMVSTDSDNDTADNYAEYIMGSNPTNSQSYLALTIQEHSTHAYNVAFTSFSNRLYTLLYGASLNTTNWSILQSNLPGDGTLIPWIHTNTAPRGFYRVEAKLP